jgi:hypothetical protein
MLKHKPSFIERIAEKLHLIENLHNDAEHDDFLPPLTEAGELTSYPPPENGTTGSNTKRRAGSGARVKIT